MSKSVKYLIAGISALILLVGGIVILKVTEPDENSDGTSVSETTVSQTESVLLYDNATDSVKSITVENSSSSYEITRTKEATEDTTAEYTVSGLENIPLNTEIVNNLPSNMASLTAKKVVEENATDLAKYGLDSEFVKVKVTFDDETEKNIILGDDSPSGDIYMRFDGENKVYTVKSDTYMVFRNDKDYYISLVCLAEPATTDDYPKVNYLEVIRPDLDYNIKFEYDEKSANSDYSGGTSSTHIMTSPVFAYVDIGEGSTAITHGLFGLTASSIAVLNPTDEELSFAGMDEPVCTVVMDTDDGKTRTLKIGDTLDVSGTTYYMGYFDDTDIIYCFNKESLPWIDMKPLDIASSLVVGTYFNDIGKLTIETEGHDKLEFVTSGSDEEENFAVTLNGQEYDIERFKEFYKFIINTQAEEIYMEEPDADKLICSLKIERNDEFEDETVEFYQGEDKTVIIKHNGVTSFINKINYDYVNVLLKNIDKVNTDEEFITVWK